MTVFSYKIILERKESKIFIEEIKTTSHFCKKKATHILGFIEGKPIYTGAQIEVGGNDTYKLVYRPHYFRDG